MKVYSILAHPNEQSLNSKLFAMANDHFKSQGHEVEELRLYQVLDDLNRASDTMHNDLSSTTENQMYSSRYLYNYGRAASEGFLDEFAKNEIEKLKAADILFVQTPILVWTIPAVLKFYMENTFILNALFSVDQPWSDTDFKINKWQTGKKVFFSMVTGSSKGMTESVTGGEDALVTPIKSMFTFVGYDWLPHHIIWGTTKTWGPCEEYLTNFESFLQSNFGE